MSVHLGVCLLLLARLDVGVVAVAAVFGVAQRRRGQGLPRRMLQEPRRKPSQQRRRRIHRLGI